MIGMHDLTNIVRSIFDEIQSERNLLLHEQFKYIYTHTLIHIDGHKPPEETSFFSLSPSLLRSDPGGYRQATTHAHTHACTFVYRCSFN